MNDAINEPARQPATIADRLAREIKRLRLDAGLSQRALASKIGYSRQYVSMTEWENANLPSYELVSAIDAALGANGTLIALHAYAKVGQQAARRQSTSALSASKAPRDSRVTASIVNRSTLSRPFDPCVAAASSAGRSYELTEVSAIYPCQAEAAKELRDLAKGAGAVDVMAVRGLGILGLNDSLLRKVIPAGARLRVLLLDPDSAAVARRAEEIGESTESLAAGIRLAITRIKELAVESGSVEVYTYDRIPLWRIIRIDDVVFVSAFTVRHEGHAAPMHRIEPTRGSALHHALVGTLEQAVSHADRVV
ncbi:helix-turn-helix domain-containing protein [Nocardia amamiensis]|uniref:helix-turn-helix domain-containing protein n=1 Tax=Nocardia amamiensis TaxID=404578 RepID=UPI00082F12AD|nr:helix-turn-helix domain-containing protein [Nocardia amamiensis]